MSNPKRRRKHSRRRRRNPAVTFNPKRRSRRRRTRRNPLGITRSVGQIFGRTQITDALFGGIGFIATKVAPTFLPIPVQLKTGVVKYATGAVTAFGLGLLGRQVLGRKAGDMIWLGGLISVASDLISELVLPMLAPPALAPAGGTTSGMMGSYIPAGSARGNSLMGSYIPELSGFENSEW